MATILLSAAGAAVGAGFGGTVLGLSGAIIGRAVGGTIGRAIDQRILGSGSESVDVGRIERFRLLGASEGAAIPQIWGRVRVSGQVIWASRFLENTTSSGGGKGTQRSAKTTQYHYSVSVAVALCEGVISRVGRIWADGNEIDPESLNLRVYSGREDQLPDPKIEAVEGVENVPTYRGTAYLVIEDLDLAAYGNRIPQFSFEVMRPAQGETAEQFSSFDKIIPGVCLIPGTGEYALATTPVHYAYGVGLNRSANGHVVGQKTDFSNSLDALVAELPNAKAVSLVVSWFGSDLRCASCQPKPKVEQTEFDGVPMAWSVSGVVRSAADTVPRIDNRPIYGGTPADASVVEAIQALNAAGKDATFYPFLLMDQLSSNVLPDPWGEGIVQPALPWRGRVTLNLAPGQAGSTDRTLAAEAEVAAFFGTAQPHQFVASGPNVLYVGPPEWSYRRFILHYAHLCKNAGGVAAFCIGSEMRALTQIRGLNDSFPAVQALRQLAAEVKGILPATKITYAADWSEYFGYHSNGNVYFHLDPLWADPAIDFIGIDNYMPISDWRDGENHADADWGDIFNRDYLQVNIAGGEGFDWYYADEAGANTQSRLPIVDTAYGEHWVYRSKDLRSWWSNSHHERVQGVRSLLPTAWIAGSKPIRFTEFGCAAIDKGTNQPNRFLDPKSSESGLPRHSNGLRDDLIQLAYYQAMHRFWTNSANNPDAFLYAGTMVDFANSVAWAWDARPFPAFPAASTVWSDGDNYNKGHWLNGRSTNLDLSAVLGEICNRAGLFGTDMSKARGIVRGYSIGDIGTGRAAMQPLLLAYPSDVIERNGELHIQARTARGAHFLNLEHLALSSEIDGAYELQRTSDVEMPRHLRLSFIEAEADFPVSVAAATAADKDSDAVSQSELPLLLTASEATTIAERWLAEAQVSRDSVRFALPKSQLSKQAGDTVEVAGQSYRIDRVESSDLQLIEAVRVDPNVYLPSEFVLPRRSWDNVVVPTPVYPLFLDLPLLIGNEMPHAPYACAAASPWPGAVAIWSSVTSNDFVFNTRLQQAAVIGVTETALGAASSDLWDRGPAVRIRIETGSLSSVSPEAVFDGANLAAIGDGSPNNWELFQFETATLVAPKTYEISLRLRGRFGTDSLIPSIWPIGSRFVLIDNAVQQIDLPPSDRGLSRNYRFVSANLGYDDASAVALTRSFDGIGLRPYSVSHLDAKLIGDEVNLSWVRRTRVDGDSWQSYEVPLAEDSESYLVRVYQGLELKREVTVNEPKFIYTTLMQASDAITGDVTFSVAQLSNSFGPGPFRNLVIAV